MNIQHDEICDLLGMCDNSYLDGLPYWNELCDQYFPGWDDDLLALYGPEDDTISILTAGDSTP